MAAFRPVQSSSSFTLSSGSSSPGLGTPVLLTSSSSSSSPSQSGRPSGHLIVKLYKAKNLPKMAKLLGKTDCYCVTNVVDPGAGITKTWKTHTKSNDFSPEWKEEYSKSLNKFSTLPTLQFEFWHHETVGADRLIGRASIDLREKWSTHAHPPLCKGKIPIALESAKKKPSNKAKLSLLVLSVCWMPNYNYLKSYLDSHNRLHTGDGSKRITVPLVEALGPDIFLTVEFSGKKTSFYLLQKIDSSLASGSSTFATGSKLWTQIQFGPTLQGQVAESTKIQRYSGKGNEYFSQKEHQVRTVKKLQDLKVWSHWNRLYFQTFDYGTVFEGTYADLHQSFIRNPGAAVNPSTYEETKAQVLGSGVICNDIDATVYYPITISGGEAPVPVGFLSSTFTAKSVETSLWIFQSAYERGLFVDLSYDEKKKRTEYHFKAPKLVQGHPCAMKISLPDLKPPFPRGFIRIRVLFVEPSTLRSVSLNDVFPDVFRTFPKTKTV